jgi:hypothetical protein
MYCSASGSVGDGDRKPIEFVSPNLKSKISSLKRIKQDVSYSKAKNPH